MTDDQGNVFNFDEIKKQRDQRQPRTESDSTLPLLHIDSANPDKTVAALGEILAQSGDVFERGTPVRIARDLNIDATIAHLLDPDGFVIAAHRHSRPYVLKEGVRIDSGLPRAMAAMYLSYREWGLRPLNGFTSAPLLRGDGAIRTAQGYDVETGMYCEGIPDIASRIPDNVTDNDAERALASIRRRHRTLPYADAETVREGSLTVVDLRKKPGMDESSFLTQGLTAVCRSSLGLCPGGSIHGAHLSGSGAGKGLTARCVLETAYGRSPSSIAQTTTKDELDKQISSALMEGGPSLLLDNFNNTTLASSVLASALTERPSKVRILGRSRLAVLNALVFIMVTGNGLILSRDIIRRFLRVELDARVENAEVRDFTSNHLLQDLRRARADVLVEFLTIWRWGKLKKLGRGKSLGSYEQWCEWSRDPLLELGCQDPVKRMLDTKARDPARQETANAFHAWWRIFESRPTTAQQVSVTPEVLDHLDPMKRSRQYIAAALAKLDGTRIAGFVLKHKPTVGKWSADYYVLEKTNEHEDWVRTSRLRNEYDSLA